MMMVLMGTFLKQARWLTSEKWTPIARGGWWLSLMACDYIKLWSCHQRVSLKSLQFCPTRGEAGITLNYLNWKWIEYVQLKIVECSQRSWIPDKTSWSRAGAKTLWIEDWSNAGFALRWSGNKTALDWTSNWKLSVAGYVEMRWHNFNWELIFADPGTMLGWGEACVEWLDEKRLMSRCDTSGKSTTIIRIRVQTFIEIRK